MKSMQEEQNIEKEGQQPEKPSKLKTWIKRFGFLGFMFFLIKGLAWLIVPAVIYYFAASE
jgi:hypothetical protein